MFGRNKNKEFEIGHNEGLLDENDDYVSPLKRTDKGRVASHALTVDEVSGYENVPMRSSEKPQSGSVYESMKEHQKNTEVQGFGDDYVPSWAASKNDEPILSAFSERSKIEMTEEETAAAESRAKEILKSTNVRTDTTEHIIPVDNGAQPIAAKSEPIQSDAAAAFLERCKMVVNGNLPQDVKPEPIVMEPAKAEEANTKVPEPTEDLEKLVSRIAEPKAEEPTVAVAEDNVKKAEPAPREVKVEVEVIPSDTPASIMHTATIPAEAATAATVVIPAVASEATVVMPPIAPDVKVYGRVIKGKVIEQTPDGNIEVSELIKAQKEAEAKKKAEMDATRMVGDLNDVISQKAEDSFNVSRELYEGDYEESDEAEIELPYYESEDSSLEYDEYKNLNDAARLRTDVAAKISAGTVRSAVSFVVFALLLLFSLPIMDLMPIKAVGIISIIFTAVSIGVNYDIFKEFKNIAGKPGFDVCVALTAVLAVVQTGVSAFAFDGSFPFLAAAACFLLAVNRAVKLNKLKRLAKGLQIIATSETKNAVVLAEEKAAKIMASGLVDGEVVGLCATETVNLQNFVKNSSYKSPFDLKVKVLFFVGLAVAAAAGIAGGLLGGFGAGITLATAVMCCCYPASALLSAEMPMNRIVNRLFNKGAVLAGFKGAYDINLSNVVAINTSDLFPEGSVKLYNMKTLGENELGPTLTAAAAVAIAAKSPLAGIFRGMVGVSDEQLPKVNGVQYEDKMGISGWIGDNTVLIGNRNLMQGHSVAVPPASVDQKILKAGYFPVYIACKGIPCLLFIVKYEADPNVTAELKKLCSTGMTVLVNPQDPNASDAMICDYFGIPDDALKCMKHNGRVVYERQTAPKENVSAPALYGEDVTGYFSAITSSININSIIAILTAVFVVSAVLGTLLLIYLAIMGKLSIVTAFSITVYQLIFMLASAIVTKVKDR